MVEKQGKQDTGEKEPDRKPWTLREFGGKTVWDWLQLLIVPVVLSLITVAFAWQQNTRQERLEDKRAEAERELGVQRAQDEALQAYIDQMSTLILEKDLRHADAGDEMLTVARARTLATLGRLDPSRKTAVMQFLTEAGLVQGNINQNQMSSSVGVKESFEGIPVISLSGADLSGTDLSELGGGIGGHIEASSKGAYYFGTDGLTILGGADFSYADLSGANLGNASLVTTNLQQADLSNANLLNADLSGANLLEADLSGADLSQQGEWSSPMSEEEVKQLARQAASLKGATMPDGQKYEDWLKSKGKGAK